MRRVVCFLILMVCFSSISKSEDKEKNEPLYIHGENGIEIDRQRGEIRAFKNAYVKRGSSILYGDIIYGYYIEDKNKKPALSKVEAFGNVKITMPDKVLKAREGRYNLSTDVIFFRGDVRITEKQNHLKGDYATMDRKTGRTTILNHDPDKKKSQFSSKGSPRGQVRVLLGG